MNLKITFCTLIAILSFANHICSAENKSAASEEIQKALDEFVDEMANQVELCEVMSYDYGRFKEYMNGKGIKIQTMACDETCSVTIHMKEKKRALKIIDSDETRAKFDIITPKQN